jgi:hypothetical protein
MGEGRFVVVVMSIIALFGKHFMPLMVVDEI